MPVKKVRSSRPSWATRDSVLYKTNYSSDINSKCSVTLVGWVNKWWAGNATVKQADLAQNKTKQQPATQTNPQDFQFTDDNPSDSHQFMLPIAPHSVLPRIGLWVRL